MRCLVCGSALDSEAAFCPHCCTPIAEAPSYDEYDYDAFISYRHLPQDKQIATRLQRQLEGMRIPKDLRRPEGAPRLRKFFRDEDELPTSSSLSDQIREALKRSRYLLVICSKHTTESIWVQREVELFSSFHGRDHVCIALIDGEPAESFPPLMLSRIAIDEDGNKQVVEDEPLAADFRAGTRTQFRSESMRVAAMIIGCGYDELVHRQRARRMRIAAIAASLVAFVSTTFATFSLWQHHQIEQNYRQAQINESAYLARDAQELLANGNRMHAIQVALSALPTSSTASNRPYVPEAQLALERALEVYPSFDSFRSSYSINEVTSTYAWSTKGLQAMLSISHDLIVSDIRTGSVVSRTSLNEFFDDKSPTALSDTEIVFCEDNILLKCESSLALIDAQDGKVTWKRELETSRSHPALACSRDGSTLAVLDSKTDYDLASSSTLATIDVQLIDAHDGSLLENISLPSFTLRENTDLERTFLWISDPCAAFDADGRLLAVAGMGELFLVDLNDMTTRQQSLTQPFVTDLAFLDDLIVVVGSSVPCDLGGRSGAYYINDAQICISAFDRSFDLKWEKTEQPTFPVDAYARSSSDLAPFIAGRFSDDDNEWTDVIVCGREIIAFDARTGTERSRFQAQRTVCACHVRDNGAIIAVDQDGKMMMRIVGSQKDARVTEALANIYDQTIGYAFCASIPFLDEGKDFYIAAYHPDTETYRLFRRVRTNENEFEGHSSLSEWSDYSKWVWSTSDPDTPIIGCNDASIAAFDPTTLQPLWTCDVPGNDLRDNAFDVYTSGSSLYLAYKDDLHPDRHPIQRISLADGKVLSPINLTLASEDDFDVMGVEEFDCGGRRCVLVLLNYEAAAYDLSTGEKVLSILNEDSSDKDADAKWHNRSCTIFDDSILIVQKNDRERRWRVYDSSDGHPLSSNPDGQTLSNSANFDSCLTCSNDDALIAALCPDNVLKLYERRDSSILWETDAIPATITSLLSFTADGQGIVAQDKTGRIVLISSVDGHVIKSSGEELEPIDWCQRHGQNGATLIAHYKRPLETFEYGMHGLYVISLDEASFGVLSDLPYGVRLTNDASAALFYNDGGTYKYYRLPYYQLDELIDRAHTLIQGHEMTDAEWALYRR